MDRLRLGYVAVVGGAMLAAACAARANDSAAELSIGGLQFVRTNDIAMESEDLRISLDRVSVRRQAQEVIIEASARSFLHHQVRSMVGCLALVGQGKWDADDLAAALAARDRAALGLNAPPDGLYFVAADY